VRESLAFSGRKNVLNQSAPVLVEFVPDFLPIECVDTGNLYYPLVWSR
jgi:hypothetical protein